MLEITVIRNTLFFKVVVIIGIGWSSSRCAGHHLAEITFSLRWYATKRPSVMLPVAEWECSVPQAVTCTCAAMKLPPVCSENARGDMGQDPRSFGGAASHVAHLIH